MQQRVDLTPDENTMSMPLKQAFCAVCMCQYVGLTDVNTQFLMFYVFVFVCVIAYRFMHKRVMTFLGRLYFFGMGFRVVVKGKQASSVEAPIIAVAPHSSFFDAIVCIETGLPSTVSRSESLEASIFGSMDICINIGLHKN